MFMATATTATILTIRLEQNNDETRCYIGNRQTDKYELERLLTKLSSIESNQFLFIIAASNVPASAVVETLGIVQKTGLHDLAVVCPGTYGTNTGTWRITLDATKERIPSCIQGVESESGFQINWQNEKIISQQGDGD